MEMKQLEEPEKLESVDEIRASLTGYPLRKRRITATNATTESKKQNHGGRNLAKTIG